MIQRDPKAAEFEARVNAYLAQDDLLKRLGARVLPGTARHEDWGWSVLVGTELDVPQTLEFVDRLSEIADRYKDTEHVDVLIAPSGVRPSELEK